MTEISPPPPPDPRRRLRELLAIPERDRSDEQWDEIIELEIQQAPGNREVGPDNGARRNGPAPGGERKSSGDRRPAGDRNKPAGAARPGGGERQRSGPPRQGGERRPASSSSPNPGPRPSADVQPGAEQKPGDSVPAKKPFKKFHKRPPKATTPEQS